MEKPRVLIADDNEAIRTLVIALLRHEYVIDAARDGAEALETLRCQRYAVILLDLLMPNTDGFAVLDFMLTERPDLLARVIVLTAAVTSADLERLRAYPVCGVIRKPFEVEALLQAVRRCADDDTNFARGPILAAPMLLLLAAEMLRRV